VPHERGTLASKYGRMPIRDVVDGITKQKK
jgi:hypothetical protein